MITRIEATRYRCFDKLDVELGDFRVLVGANGSGKTTLSMYLYSSATCFVCAP